jgi:hypothetical protein
MTEDIVLRRTLRHGTKEDRILLSLTENERSELQAILNIKKTMEMNKEGRALRLILI